jgi:hypothetical protein
MHRNAVTRGRRWALLWPSVLFVATGCGDSLATRVTKAMDGCLSVRNEAFKVGDGEAAIARPLPKSADSLAQITGYTYGLIAYQQLAEGAQTQAELTCALELGSRYNSEDTRQWLRTYLRHPNAPVALLARRELQRLVEGPGLRSLPPAQAGPQ